MLSEIWASIQANEKALRQPEKPIDVVLFVSCYQYF